MIVISLEQVLTPVMGASLVANAFLLLVVVWQMLRETSADRRAKGWESEMQGIKRGLQRLDARRGLAKTWSSRLYWACVLYGVLISAGVGLVARSPSQVPVVMSYIKAGAGALLGPSVRNGPSLSATALALATAALVAPAAAFWLGRSALDRYVRHLAAARKQLNKERAAALQRVKDELPFKVALPLLQKYDPTGDHAGYREQRDKASAAQSSAARLEKRCNELARSNDALAAQGYELREIVRQLLSLEFPKECAATVARQIQPLNARIQHYLCENGPGSQEHADSVLSPTAASTRARRSADNGDSWDERIVGMLSPGGGGSGGSGIGTDTTEGDGEPGGGATSSGTSRRGRGKSPRARRVVSMSNMVEASTKEAVAAGSRGDGEVESKQRKGRSSTS